MAHHYNSEERIEVSTTKEIIGKWYGIIAIIGIAIMILLVWLFEFRDLRLIFAVVLICFGLIAGYFFIQPNAQETHVVYDPITGKKRASVEKFKPKLPYEKPFVAIDMRADTAPKIGKQVFSTQKGNVQGEPTPRFRADVGTKYDTEADRSMKAAKFVSITDEARDEIVKAVTLEGINNLMNNQESADKAVELDSHDFEDALHNDYAALCKDLSIDAKITMHDLDYGDDVVNAKASEFKVESVNRMLMAMTDRTKGGYFTEAEAKAAVMSIMDGVRYTKEDKNQNFTFEMKPIPGAEKITPEVAKEITTILREGLSALNKTLESKKSK